MGQELSQPLSPHGPNISPISSEGPHTSSLLYDNTINTMSDGSMVEDRCGSTTSPNEGSSQTDLSAGRVDSSNNNAVNNAAELDIPDDTNPLSDTFEQKAFYQRELRPMRESKRTLPNTWVDADTTGDFDPHGEGRQARARRKKAKLSQRKKFDWNAGQYNPQWGANLRAAAKRRPILRISFRTTAGKAAFAEICANSEQDAEQACDDFLTGYRLRKRGGTDDGRGPTGVDATGVRVIAFETSLELQNQPAGRGCLGCLAKVQKCSLLENEHSWPCNDCDESGDDCQLVQVSDSSSDGIVHELIISTGTETQIGLYALPVFWQEAEMAYVLVRIQPRSLGASRPL
jgi:hypothetical protein